MHLRILVPLDGSATAERGLLEAIALASSQKEKPRLSLLHVIVEESPVPVLLVRHDAAKSAAP